MIKNKFSDENIECTKPYYFNVADNSRVSYIKKDFSSKGICKNLYGGVQYLHYNILKLGNYKSLEKLFYIIIDFIPINITHAIKKILSFKIIIRKQ